MHDLNTLITFGGQTDTEYYRLIVTFIGVVIAVASFFYAVLAERTAKKMHP